MQTGNTACGVYVGQNGITLIEVPHRWNRTKESLAASILKTGPTFPLDPPGVEPIPLKTDEKFLELPLSHGQAWDGLQDMTDW